MTIIDFWPAVQVLRGLIDDLPDDQLTGPTPCGGITVADLLDHVATLSQGFTGAAYKSNPVGAGRPPEPDGSRLGDDWRHRLPALLDGLATAWTQPAAWTGMTRVGGLELPAEVAAAAGLDEVIVHGWDLARATGRPYPADEPGVAAAVGFATDWVSTVAAQSPDGSPGLFGPPISVNGDASQLDRLVGLTGRDPAWQPSPTR